MVTQLDPVAVVTPSGLVSACSYCCSFLQLAELDRQFKRQVSHGICPRCLALITAQMEARS